MGPLHRSVTVALALQIVVGIANLNWLFAAILSAAQCNGFSSTNHLTNQFPRHHIILSLSTSGSNHEQGQLEPRMIPPPPPTLKRASLPVMLAGGLFLFATSVPSSQRARAKTLLKLAQEALQSDPTVMMELGPGIEAGNVYASSSQISGSMNQLVLQFQINGGNAWAQGITYGIEDENGLKLVDLEVANMDAVLNNQSFKVPIL